MLTPQIPVAHSQRRTAAIPLAQALCLPSSGASALGHSYHRAATTANLGCTIETKMNDTHAGAHPGQGSGRDAAAGGLLVNGGGRLCGRLQNASAGPGL